jgi:hypothetical protein
MKKSYCDFFVAFTTFFIYGFRSLIELIYILHTVHGLRVEAASDYAHQVTFPSSIISFYLFTFFNYFLIIFYDFYFLCSKAEAFHAFHAHITSDSLTNSLLQIDESPHNEAILLLNASAGRIRRNSR